MYFNRTNCKILQVKQRKKNPTGKSSPANCNLSSANKMFPSPSLTLSAPVIYESCYCKTGLNVLYADYSPN